MVGDEMRSESHEHQTCEFCGKVREVWFGNRTDTLDGKRICEDCLEVEKEKPSRPKMRNTR